MNKNPFVLPGFGQEGPLGSNPVLASMEMMRQAWEGLPGAAGAGAVSMKPVMSVEELDKRIADLRAIENWLRMNLSMLNSTIQGLEVQRATIAALQSFAETGLASVNQAAASGEPNRAASGEPSPLEKVLATWSAGSRPEGSGAEAPTAPANEAQPPSSPENAGSADLTAAATAAAQGWWAMVQQQFQTLAAATAAAQGDAQPTPQAAEEKGASSSRAASGPDSTPAAGPKAPVAGVKTSRNVKPPTSKGPTAKAPKAAKSSGTKRTPKTQ